MTLKTSLLKSLSLIACGALFSVTALAQSTPIPKAGGHEGHNHATASHSEAADVEIIEGTFTELEGDHVIGSSKAPSTMIIYASVTCPHCSHWFGTAWPAIKTNYVETDKLRVIFREYPTAPAELAYAGFLIANCAPEEKYFENIEYQMAEQANLMHSMKLGVVGEAYLRVAIKAGLADAAAMNSCLNNKAEFERIEKSRALAQSGKIQSVPNFIINGSLYDGKSELAPLTAYLDKLADRGATPLP